MSGYEVAGEICGAELKKGNLAEYRPAYPLGNERDARIIAASSGLPIEMFLKVQPVEEIYSQVLEVGDVDDKKAS